MQKSLSDNRKIHTQVKNWRHMYENEQPLAEKHWTASKIERNTSQNEENDKTSCEQAQH